MSPKDRPRAASLVAVAARVVVARRRAALLACAVGAGNVAGWARWALPASAAPDGIGSRQEVDPEPASEQTGRPLVYVALGASDSVGVGAAGPARDGWVPQVLGRLPAGSRLVNLGVGGTLLHAALSQQVPAAVAAAPDLVTVWLAVNDFNAHVPLDQYAADLDTLLRIVREQTAAVVATGNLPDLSLVPAYRGTDPAVLRAEVARWNAAIADVVARRGALLVDLASHWSELADHPEYVSGDGFHPGNEGYRRLADLFWEVLAPVMSAAEPAEGVPPAETAP